jgi:hypothetical protein
MPSFQRSTGNDVISSRLEPRRDPRRRIQNVAGCLKKFRVAAWRKKLKTATLWEYPGVAPARLPYKHAKRTVIAPDCLQQTNEPLLIC